jgi:hypothetical protein
VTLKSTDQIRNEIMIVGITARLEELNRERATLIRMLQRAQGGDAPVTLTIPDDDKSSTNGHGRKNKPYVHWMQRPENKARVQRTIRKMQRMAAKKRKAQNRKPAGQ